MMNKFIFLFLVLMGGFATNASADPLYFTADKVTFGDIAENASYESDFGLYSLADPSNMYKVFSYKKEPGANKTVTISNWGELDDGFGFWFGVHTGGLSDSTADYFWFSDPLLNRYAGGGSIDTSLNHLKVAFTPASGILVSLDDQLGGSASDNDFDDMVVFGKGCNIESLPPTAPVPEPATMLLFGAGLIGLAGGSRRKK